VFKARLDGALSNLVRWNMSLLMVGGLELDDDISGPFQTKPLYGSSGASGKKICFAAVRGGGSQVGCSIKAPCTAPRLPR